MGAAPGAAMAAATGVVETVEALAAGSVAAAPAVAMAVVAMAAAAMAGSQRRRSA